MRRWLSLYALSITSIVIVAFLIPLAILIKDLSADRALGAAEREGQAVARFVAGTTLDSTASLEASLEAITGISVILDTNAVLGATLPSGVEVESARRQAQAYRQPVEDGQAVIVPVVRSPTSTWLVVVHVPAAALGENVAAAWLILGGLGLGLMILALLVADRLGRAVLEPVDELVDATHRLGEGDLSVRVKPTGPRELAEVGEAFNILTQRVVSLMSRERESAADLAHRLRTPLTALKLHTEALSGQVDVDTLLDDIDDLERATSRIIAEARRPSIDTGGKRSDVATVVGERARFWGHLADDQERTWSLTLKVDSHLSDAPEADLEAMLDALLGNVFAHTPNGTGYRIALEFGDSDGVELTICDDGPGIASPILLDRGASGAGSTGLGVDIVRRIAEQHGGSAEWSGSDTGGTCARVMLPLAVRH